MKLIDVLLCESITSGHVYMGTLRDYQRINNSMYEHRDGTRLRMVSTNNVPAGIRGLRIRNLLTHGHVSDRVFAMAKERLRDGS